MYYIEIQGNAEEQLLNTQIFKWRTLHTEDTMFN